MLTLQAPGRRYLRPHLHIAAVDVGRQPGVPPLTRDQALHCACKSCLEEREGGNDCGKSGHFLRKNGLVFTHSWCGHIELIIIANYNGPFVQASEDWVSARCPRAHTWIHMCVCGSFFSYVFRCINSKKTHGEWRVASYKITVGEVGGGRSEINLGGNQHPQKCCSFSHSFCSRLCCFFVLFFFYRCCRSDLLPRKKNISQGWQGFSSFQIFHSLSCFSIHEQFERDGVVWRVVGEGQAVGICFHIKQRSHRFTALREITQLRGSSVRNAGSQNQAMLLVLDKQRVWSLWIVCSLCRNKTVSCRHHRICRKIN